MGSYGQIPLWTAHSVEMMIALNSSFQEDQNQPKYHLIWIRESVFLNYKPHMCIFDQVNPKEKWTPLEGYKYK